MSVVTRNRKLAAAAIAASFAPAALAHPGDHAEFGIVNAVIHYFSAPDHLLMLVGGVAIAGLVARKVVRARATRR